jgi:hypothetical protein
LEIAEQPPEKRGPYLELLHRIEELEKKAESAERIEPWSHEYKGDAYWVACRHRLIELIDEKGCVRFTDIRLDPWFIVEAPKLDSEGKGLNDAKKWLRAVDMHFVPGSPREVKDPDLIPFHVRGRGKATLFLCRKDELHCAVDEAVRLLNVNSRRAGGIISRLLRAWKGRAAATEDECHRCGPIGRRADTDE